MKRQAVRNRLGKTIGFIEDSELKITARDQLNRTLGYYDKRSDRTYDRLGRSVANGNVLMSFFQF